MLGLPRFTDFKDPRNILLARAAAIALVLLVPAAAIFQQFALWLQTQTYEKPTAEKAVSEEVTQPGISELTLASKFLVKIAEFERSLGAPAEAGPDAEPPTREQALPALDTIAETRVDRLRIAMVAAALKGKDEALSRLTALEKEAEPGGDLASDIQWLRRLFGPEGRGALAPEAEQALRDRHGWFAILALTLDAPPGDPSRFEAVGGGDSLVAFSLMAGGGQCVLFVTGLVVFCILLARLIKREIIADFAPTGLPPGVYLEMFDVFLLIFVFVLGMQIAALWLTGTASVVALVVLELLTWLVGLCALWPRLRGLRWVLVSRDLGWTRGNGLWREIGAGALGYLASFPIAAGWHVIVALASGMAGAEEEPGPGGFLPFDPPLTGSWVPVILGALGAVVWAPLVEETMFRGALYRYLRTRMGWIAGVAVTSALFGLIHPYSTAGLVEVGLAGVVFGLLREWRGSLVAPVTAHFLHNGTLTLIMLGGITAIG